MEPPAQKEDGPPEIPPGEGAAAEENPVRYDPPGVPGDEPAPHAGGDVYTAPQAAKVLGLSDRRVRQMLEAGELEGSRDRSGKWWVSQRAVHEVLEDRGSPRGAPRRAVPGLAGQDEAVDKPRGNLRRPPGPPESVRDLASRVEDLSYRLGRSEARLEFTEQAESTVREERNRLLRELDEERAERRRLAERLERIEEERREPAPEDIGRPAGSPPPEPTEADTGETPGDLGGRRSSWWRRFFGFR